MKDTRNLLNKYFTYIYIIYIFVGFVILEQKLNKIEYKLDSNLQHHLVGDVNNDGLLNISDMARIKSHMMNVVKLDKEQYKRADINKDGIVDQTDLDIVTILVQRKLGVK